MWEPKSEGGSHMLMGVCVGGLFACQLNKGIQLGKEFHPDLFEADETSSQPFPKHHLAPHQLIWPDQTGHGLGPRNRDS